MDFFINKSILVTGGAGFIGSNIVENLINKNVKFVRVLDNFSSGNIENIKPFLNLQNFELIKGDICDFDTCVKCMEGIDIVCHQAALGSVPRSIKNPLLTHQNNVNGFLNILHAAKESNIKRFIYASSSSVYGDEKNLPKVEHRTGNLLSPYAATKFIDEIYAKIYTDVYGMETIGLRYFNVFGPRQNPDGPYAAVIPKFINYILDDKEINIFGDGKQSRDFTYIDNVVHANLNAMSTEKIPKFGEALNIGKGGCFTLNELIINLKKIMNKEFKVKYVEKRFGDILHSNADISKAFEFINFKPKVNFYDGLIKTTEFFIRKKNNESIYQNDKSSLKN